MLPCCIEDIEDHQCAQSSQCVPVFRANLTAEHAHGSPHQRGARSRVEVVVGERGLARACGEEECNHERGAGNTVTGCQNGPAPYQRGADRRCGRTSKPLCAFDVICQGNVACRWVDQVIGCFGRSPECRLASRTAGGGTDELFGGLPSVLASRQRRHRRPEHPRSSKVRCESTGRSTAQVHLLRSGRRPEVCVSNSKHADDRRRNREMLSHGTHVGWRALWRDLDSRDLRFDPDSAPARSSLPPHHRRIRLMRSFGCLTSHLITKNGSLELV